MFRVALLVCAAVAGAWGQTTNVSQCTANNGDLPLYTYIEGCRTTPCVLPQLQDAVIHVFFRAPHTISTMKTLAIAYLTAGNIITVPVPFDLGANAETCNFLTNRSCPVNEGEILEYTLRMPIEPFFPAGTSLPVEFRVVDEASNAPVFCIRVPITITPPVARA